MSKYELMMWFNFGAFVLNAFLATTSWNRIRVLNGICAVISLVIAFIYLQLI